MIVTRLKQSYRHHGLVLVLGAGVSKGSGLPMWNELLSRVAADLPGDEPSLNVDELWANHVPLPVIASVLEGRCGSRPEFVERVRDALYHDFPYFQRRYNVAHRDRLVDHVLKKNPTLRAVAAMCATRDTPAEFSRNPHVRSIVTFNLDSVLQVYIGERYGKRLLRTIDRASAGANRKKISIYHLHGMLRFDAKARDRKKEAPDAVVLTEQDYFNFFNNPTSLFNYTFLYLLREWPCLFIGLSMQDENMRRLLHFSKYERMQGLLSEGRAPERLGTDTRRHFAILKGSRASQMDRVLEDSLLPLGTEVLWIDDFHEIAMLLKEVYETTGADWNLVA